jgi:hypothetical protein
VESSLKMDIIGYESRNIKHERNYATQELELASIGHTLNMWRHYLMEKRFELRTNHSGLKYLFEQTTLNSRKTRWLEFLSEYDFDIKHIKGKENKFFDTLIRRLNLMHDTTISMYHSDLKRRILDDVVTYQHYLEVKERLQQEYVQQKMKEYEMKEYGLLMHRNRIYVPSSRELRNLLLKEMHNVPYVRHPGYQKKKNSLVRSQFFWSGMKKDVVYYIAKCMECQKVKDEHRHPTDLLQPLLILEKKWEVVTIDFITKFLETTRQHDSIMVVVDKLTNDAHFVPVKTTHTLANIA